MIELTTGDLLAADAEALVNTVNTFGVMGAGIALQFKRRYPDMLAGYRDACRSGAVQIGRMLVAPTGELVGPRYVIHFPTKRHWRAPSRLSYVERGLVDLIATIARLGLQSIALPALGCGNGGLAWPLVCERITAALDPLPVRALLYLPPWKPGDCDRGQP